MMFFSLFLAGFSMAFYILLQQVNDVNMCSKNLANSYRTYIYFGKQDISEDLSFIQPACDAREPEGPAR